MISGLLNKVIFLKNNKGIIMIKNRLVAPVVKWAGGKRQIIEQIIKYVPDFSIYYEPFLGGGAVLFALQPEEAVVNDINSELINLYKVIKDNVDELIEELQKFAPSQIEISYRDGDGQLEVILKHCYIERRMIPLNLYLQEAFDAGLDDPRAHQQMERAVIEYGKAIRDLVAANIFPGDMLWKNFGITRQGKVVFYDYDEIEYLTDCNFRRVPPPRSEEDELSGEVWYPVARNDVFPETFAPFLLGHPAVREVFMRHHADLLDVAFWQAQKERILAGQVHDVFPYEQARRFQAQADTAEAH